MKQYPITLDVGDPVQMICLGSTLGASYLAHRLAGAVAPPSRGRRVPRARRGKLGRWDIVWVVRSNRGEEREFDDFTKAAGAAAGIAVLLGEPIVLDVIMRTRLTERVVLRVISAGRAS
jgi:hypothetical protein